MEGLILFGSPPRPPDVVNASTVLAIRSPDGSAPCSSGLSKALAWIGNRETPFEQAIQEAMRSGVDVDWAESALGITGDGCGYGPGSGSGYGDGYGYGI